eukprot:gnl/Chilomastix_cuspidata/1582.p2 GENE.gnl/Chilomastix_cuspidata/1582~~gnl/Chilomastix_cuspidata/1582.p2  ORF type:complete len:342 (+),score=46.32 gnl/Chilomastix_cuspidata/1582:1727-2752(+)
MYTFHWKPCGVLWGENAGPPIPLPSASKCADGFPSPRSSSLSPSPSPARLTQTSGLDTLYARIFGVDLQDTLNMQLLLNKSEGFEEKGKWVGLFAIVQRSGTGKTHIGFQLGEFVPEVYCVVVSLASRDGRTDVTLQLAEAAENDAELENLLRRMLAMATQNASRICCISGRVAASAGLRIKADKPIFLFFDEASQLGNAFVAVRQKTLQLIQSHSCGKPLSHLSGVVLTETNKGARDFRPGRAERPKKPPASYSEGTNSSSLGDLATCTYRLTFVPENCLYFGRLREFLSRCDLLEERKSAGELANSLLLLCGPPCGSRPSWSTSKESETERKRCSNSSR